MRIHLSVQPCRLAKQHHIHINGPIEKDELAGVVAEHLAVPILAHPHYCCIVPSQELHAWQTRALATRYDLLANIVHEGEAASGAYKYACSMVLGLLTLNRMFGNLHSEFICIKSQMTLGTRCKILWSTLQTPWRSKSRCPNRTSNCTS